LGLNRDVILDELQELIFQSIDLFRDKERVNKGEVRIGKVPVVPHLLGNEE